MFIGNEDPLLYQPQEFLISFLFCLVVAVVFVFFMFLFCVCVRADEIVRRSSELFNTQYLSIHPGFTL